MEERHSKGPLTNTPIPVFLFIPVMAGVGALSKLLEYLYPNIDPEVFQHCAVGVGGIYLLGLAVLWLLFGNEMKPPKGRNK